MQSVKFGFLATCAAALGACSGAQAPRFEVRDVAVTQQTEQGVVVTFLVAAENRNADPLPLKNVRYGLSLDGKRVFDGERSAETTLRRYGTQEFLLPVAFPVGEGTGIASAPVGRMPYTFDATVEYELPGTIAEALFDTGLRVPTASFGERGQLDFTGAPPAEAAGSPPQ